MHKPAPHPTRYIAGAMLAAGMIATVSTADPLDIEVIFSPPADLAPGPLVMPPSTLEVVTFAGQPRIANDGTWYGLYTFPMNDPNNPLEYCRNVAMLKDGVPFIREGYQLANDPAHLPVADFPASQQPYFDISIAGDGSVAQVLRGTDVIVTLPDGTPDPSFFDFEDNKFDLLVLNRDVVLTQGTPLDIVPGWTAPDNLLQEFSIAKVANANRMLAKADLSAGGTFDPEVTAIFEITDPGLPSQTETLRFTDEDSYLIPGLGINPSTFTASEEDVDYNADGSILIGVDISGAPFNLDGAIVLYDAPADTYSILAREGDPSPLPGRIYDSLFNNPMALNDAGDYAFLASVDGDFNTDGIIVVNDQVLIQEDDIVGTAVPGELQLGSANANIEMDPDGNIVWYGVWNELKENVCPDNPDITSTFVIFEGLFFNDQVILEGGVTEIYDVTIGGVFYPTLVIADLPNTRYGGFHMSPDGRWLIVAALVAEPDPDICAFSINNDATPLAHVLLKFDLSQLTGSDCPADFDDSGDVGTSDFFALLQNWGLCPALPAACPWDLTGAGEQPDGEVGTDDFFLLLQNWGPCE